MSFVLSGLIYLFFARRQSALGEESKIIFENQKPKCPKTVLGVVADIHAGSEKIRKTDTGNNTYPKKYKEFFPAALDEMKEAGVDLVLTVGDNTHKGVARFAEDLKKMAAEKDMEMI